MNEEHKILGPCIEIRSGISRTDFFSPDTVLTQDLKDSPNREWITSSKQSFFETINIANREKSLSSSFKNSDITDAFIIQIKAGGFLKISQDNPQQLLFFTSFSNLTAEPFIIKSGLQRHYLKERRTYCIDLSKGFEIFSYADSLEALFFTLPTDTLSMEQFHLMMSVE